MFFSGACIIMMSGPKKEWVLCTIAVLVGAVSVVLALDSVLDGVLGKDVLLKQYQMNRLLVFIDPESDTSDAGYNVLQSLIAVGSGGFFGKGIGNASQSGAGFLPEAHTDFVFALLSEEFGFLGALILLALFALLIFSTIAWRTSPTRCSCSLPASASWACGRFSCSKRWACASVSCPSRASRCPLSASAHRLC